MTTIEHPKMTPEELLKHYQEKYKNKHNELLIYKYYRWVAWLIAGILVYGWIKF